MALISAVGTPKAEQVTQPAAHHGVHAFKPAGRTQDRNVGDGGAQPVKERTTESKAMGCRMGFIPNLPPRMQSLGLPMYHGPQQRRWNTAPLAPTVAPLGSSAVCGAAPNEVQRQLPLRSTEEREFKAFGIDAYPTFSKYPEICLDFISTIRWCPKSSRCLRIHPREKSRYRRLTWERKTTHLSGLCDTPASVAIVESTASSTPEHLADSHIQQKTVPPVSVQNTSAWDPVTGLWDFGIHQEAWLPDDSSSSESSVASSPARSGPLASCHSSDTEEDENDARRKPATSGAVAQRELCRNFISGTCNMGRRCKYKHGTGEEKVTTVQEIHRKPLDHPATIPARLNSGDQAPSISPPETCLPWLQGRCWRGKTCRFHHPDINTLSPSDPSQTASYTATARSEQRFQRPPFEETCWLWLRGDCQKGHLCNYVHGDLTYDETKPPRQLVQIPARTVPEVLSTVIYKHIKIQVTEGFEIMDVVTGFETSWIYIGNVPRRVHHTQLAELLKSHGDLVDLRTPEDATGPFVVVKARFVNAAEASKVCSIVDGMEAFGSVLSAKLSISVNDEARTSRLNDTSVRIQWEAPAKTAYAGFSSKTSSDNAVAKCRSTALGKHLLKAAVHTGIPAVGRFNLRVDAVPADVDTDGLKEFLGAEAVMWGKLNYTSEVKALNGIQKLVKDSDVDVLEFNVLPPPFKGGMITAWAHLGTAAEAKKLCDHMHARKPLFTGLTRIFARHVQSLEYNLSRDIYENARKDIDALAASAWGMDHLGVSCKIQAASVLVRLNAETTQSLSKLKAELDVILSGEVVREDGKVVWDRFFTQLGGLKFVAELQRQLWPLTVRVDKIRKHIRLFGASAVRLEARRKIMERVEDFRKQSIRTIPLDSRMLGAFMNDGLSQLTKEVGDDAVQLDLWNRSLVVRGDQHVQNAVRDAVIRTRRGLSTKRLPAAVECPICFEEASAPVTLCCGHSWCKTCIIRYMITAVDQKVFPLTCLGNDAKCKEKIPLSCGKQLLPPADFEALIEASFSAYVHKNLQEFAYCPTPDCQQIYRRLPRVVVPHPTSKPSRSANHSTSPAVSTPVSVGTVLQCPSCLVRICASCQTEAHDGLDCVRPDEGDGLFEEWMKNNDVKPCPGCKMPIEKAMGCHHVTCAVCSIHLCWVCLAPFHNGAGVYGHMLAAHGSFV